MTEGYCKKKKKNREAEFSTVIRNESKGVNEHFGLGLSVSGFI